MKSFIAILLAFSFAQGQEGSLEAKDSKIEFKINNVTLVLEVGNIVTLSGQAAAMPGGGTEHGGGLVVGDKLREAGAEPGFQELDRMFAAQKAQGGFPPGSAQIVKAGGGTYEYIINLNTQDYPRGRDFDYKADPRFKGLSGSELSFALGSLGHVDEMRLISESVRNLLFACSDPKYNITDVSVPFFGTGSFHGMDPLLSVVAMLNGVERFSTTMKEMKIRLVLYGLPGPRYNADLQRVFVPLLLARYHDEARFESHLSAIKRDPYKYTKRFIEKYLEAPKVEEATAEARPPVTQAKIRNGGELPAGSCAPTFAHRYFWWLGL